MPKYGANIFNRNINREDIHAAKKYGFQFIRLALDKFTPALRDFLIGNADNYTPIPQQDLKKLLEVLDICHAENMPVVLTVLSLPGSRWKQNNNNVGDMRIWTCEEFQSQAAKFWYDLASVLKNHPAVVGYNLLNEPRPEVLFSNIAENMDPKHRKETQQHLFVLHSKIIHSIRSIDPLTPIIIDGGAYGNPKMFEGLIPYSNDPYVIYSFHMYEPFIYTNLQSNKGKFSYPGIINGKLWNKDTLSACFSEIKEFQKRHNIPNSQIMVGEFGAHRKSAGVENYLSDLIKIFKENGWHFAVYSFREDNWDEMDYELGNINLPWTYWQSLEKGEQPKLKRTPNNPIFKALNPALVFEVPDSTRK